ncbi:MAG: peptide-methionine (S)-S-oxide reductase, partial [Candidatus Obscuribacterales bacterium]|nr:peptide-methionine (S)-S-oxide reductase [Candidatus Obscuribacterales bacterium]
MEADFLDTPGVVATEVGYTGGRTSNPNYEQVCSGNTGHAEAVHVTYDPQKISFKKLVERFLRIHNPRYDNSHIR